MHYVTPPSVDLVGGRYYVDAGDNVKFGFPLAFTTTMLSWNVIEFGGLMKGELQQNTKEAIHWATDYLLKVTAHPDTIYVQICIICSASSHFCFFFVLANGHFYKQKRTQNHPLPRHQYCLCLLLVVFAAVAAAEVWCLRFLGIGEADFLERRQRYNQHLSCIHGEVPQLFFSFTRIRLERSMKPHVKIIRNRVKLLPTTYILRAFGYAEERNSIFQHNSVEVPFSFLHGLVVPVSSHHQSSTEGEVVDSIFITYL
ncbi:uncharacterized protein LOC122276036 [Carya illinoinensis]|uniref:uncharacterized protein LOC122276036 n=1 Tax=Carya illinoinensis TaxID=32201 RepID=UPI001C725656|nr:uncharacterized protein LOC122276036 [Carya illinoinensis]